MSGQGAPARDPDCGELRLLVQADHDGELDAAQAATLARHLDGCADCGWLRDDLAALSADIRAAGLREAAPPGLVRRFAPGVPPARRGWRVSRQLPGFAAGLALAASVALLLLPRAGIEDPGAAVVAAHIRALQPGHLLDVPSGSQHTVRPWFAGKLDFAPPVPDFAAQGFPLAGGRLDYLEGRPVAALVYRRGLHVIDVFVWPQAGAPEAPGFSASSGYNLAAWRQGGMAFRAASDMNREELADFVALWQRALAGA